MKRVHALEHMNIDEKSENKLHFRGSEKCINLSLEALDMIAVFSSM